MGVGETMRGYPESSTRMAHATRREVPRWSTTPLNGPTACVGNRDWPGGGAPPSGSSSRETSGLTAMGRRERRYASPDAGRDGDGPSPHARACLKGDRVDAVPPRLGDGGLRGEVDGGLATRHQTPATNAARPTDRRDNRGSGRLRTNSRAAPAGFRRPDLGLEGARGTGAARRSCLRTLGSIGTWKKRVSVWIRRSQRWTAHRLLDRLPFDSRVMPSRRCGRSASMRAMRRGRCTAGRHYPSAAPARSEIRTRPLDRRRCRLDPDAGRAPCGRRRAAGPEQPIPASFENSQRLRDSGGPRARRLGRRRMPKSRRDQPRTLAGAGPPRRYPRGRHRRPLICLASTFTFHAPFLESELLPRFLGIEVRRDRRQRPFMVEREQALATARASYSSTLIASIPRRHAAVGPIAGPSYAAALQHSKIVLLIWGTYAPRCLVRQSDPARLQAQPGARRRH